MTETFRNPRFDALRNALYHTARRDFLDRKNRFLNLIVIVLGAGVVSKLVERWSFAAICLELSVVIISAAQLVYDFGSRARDHQILQKRYYDLLIEIEAQDMPSIEQNRLWNSRMLLIAADEPPTFRALDAIAYNNALASLYDDPEILKSFHLHTDLLHSLFKNVFAFNNTQFSPKAALLTSNT